MQFGHGDDVQEWAMQDGEVKLQVEDSDLDQPIKYVLLPGLDMMELTYLRAMTTDDGFSHDLAGACIDSSRHLQQRHDHGWPS